MLALNNVFGYCYSTFIKHGRCANYGSSGVMGSSVLKQRDGKNQPHVSPIVKAVKEEPAYEVLLYIPNIIGYLRLFFLLSAFWFLGSSPAFFVFLYSISIILDGFDGYAARKLHQCSLFGAWFDVVLDNLSRGLLWTHIHPLLYLVSSLEWLAFVCNHCLGAEWQRTLAQHKNKQHQNPPRFVTNVMKNNFRNPWGIWAIAGLHVFPLWLLGMKYGVFASHLWFLPTFLQPSGVIVLGSGRLLCGIVELWSIIIHISDLLVNTSSCT